MNLFTGIRLPIIKSNVSLKTVSNIKSYTCLEKEGYLAKESRRRRKNQFAGLEEVFLGEFG